MKNWILQLICYTFIAGCAHAVTLQIGSFSGPAKQEFWVPVYLENEVPVSGVQLEIQNDSGLFLLDSLTVNNEFDDFSFLKRENKILFFSLTGAVISPGNHQLFSLQYNCLSADFPEQDSLRFAEGLLIANPEGNLVESIHTVNGFLEFQISTLVQTDQTNVPLQYSLSQNFPNPFNPSTTIEFELEQPGHVLISVFNTSGQKVKQCVDRFLKQGHYQINIDGNSLSSGVYYYHISVNSYSACRKMLLLK